jgi:hypothetical protein
MIVVVAMMMIVDLRVIMVVRVTTAMRVTMAMRVIVTVHMIVAVRMLLVGAMLWIEWHFHRREARAEPAQHVLDHVVTANAQPIADDLHVDMPVADMPGEPRQFVTIGRGDFDKRLRPADDAHDAAVVEHETVTVTQCRRLRQVEQEGRAALAHQNGTAAMALMRVERNLINGAGAVPLACGLDCMRAFHSAHQACCGFISTQF